MSSPLVVGFRRWTGVEGGGRFSDSVREGVVEIGGTVTCGLGWLLVVVASKSQSWFSMDLPAGLLVVTNLSAVIAPRSSFSQSVISSLMLRALNRECRSFRAIVDTVNQVRQQQERQQKQLEDTISISFQQQEAARLERENQEKRFSDLIQQISRLSCNNSEGNGQNARNNQDSHRGGREGDNEEVHTHDMGERSVAKGIKLDFPRFFGKNPAAWIYMANQYFLYHQVPPGQRIFLASFHLEEEALVWFQDASEAGTFHSWEEFTQAVQVRFGSSAYDDPMEALTRLKQVHSVTTYKAEFELLSNRIKGVSEKNKLSCFLSGLKDEVRLPVRMLNPTTLNDAIGLAKIQEEYVWATRRSWKGTSSDFGGNSTGGSILGTPKVLSNNKLSYQKVSEAQMQERRKKGLYYFCEDKWHQGHKCIKPKIYVLDGMNIFRDETVEDQDKVEIVEEEMQHGDIAFISLQAIGGTPNPKTMRIVGQINKKRVVILIDTGSTHNFVDTTVAAKCDLAVDTDQSIQVCVANRDVVESLGRTSAVTVHMQGCDMVMGVQWLLSLSPILWNFTELQMQFSYGTKTAVLKGLTSTNAELVDNRELATISKVGSKGFWLQFLAVEPIQKQSTIPPQIEELLQTYQVVFEEPKGLPPHRSRDHQIILKNESIPVSLRPYRYPHFQKAEIENIVADLLKTGVIRPSQSPFSSPVLLVRKADGSWRMCIHYRMPNEATIKDKYPIPVVDELLDELFGSTIFSKLDLRSVYNKDLETHLTHLATILGVLKQNQLYAKKSKCHFACQEIEYLGHLISKEGVKANPRKLEAMINWPVPKTLKALRGFLGLTGYYRKFIQHYDFTQKFVIECDACGVGVGAVLIQNHKPIAFLSQALKGKNLTLSTYEKELLALVLAIKKWRPYLLGSIFTIRTDHLSLKYLLEQNVGTAAQQKWISKLLGYEFSIEYKKEIENKVVDALSRNDCQSDEAAVYAISYPTPVWLEELKQAYASDPVTQQQLSLLTDGLLHTILLL
ncbi:uncharacterized protein LOC121255061 [Juglans microcarpa x Juglans regia]|uniref:uncharacterized protein LOC121255061 n=1 Tax=Juglans microcarpa x Juglans regia TaxID=2249226 RepID=UPI001B7DA5EE|nr:uncharacterized protein LOC121255061 [Juglans microcarpa x Juglans regia]